MLKLPSDLQAERLRTFLLEQGYSDSNLRQTIGLKELPASRLRNLPRLKDLTREPNCINTLLRWFWIGLPQNSQVARGLVPEWVVSLALECGLLREENGELHPEAMLFPMDKFVFAADHTQKIDCGAADLVLWPNPTSRLLSRFTVRQPSRATLDVGTGSGVQALLAADHSDSVVGTDLNPRAVAFAAFSAQLNGIKKIEFLAGDGFSPVASRKFDLIVSNPPFFMTPREQYLFCDNPLELDQLCRKFAREAPLHLNEGGYFQMLCEWAGIEGQNWHERLSEWFEGTGCDALVLKGYSQDPAEYAEEHIRSMTAASDQDSRLYDSYMDYYRKHKVVSIQGGAVAMHRRSGTNWMLMEEVEHTPKDAFGELVAEIFARRDFLLSHETSEQLLQLKPKLDSQARLEQAFHLLNEEWKLQDVTLRIPKGLNPFMGLQPAVAQFLIRCDGQRLLKDIVDDFAATVDAPREQVQQECMEAVRKLIERGFLLY
jgi:methylase of polypeptide subunit release factors